VGRPGEPDHARGSRLTTRRRRGAIRFNKWAYMYPISRTIWKKSMQVLQTAEEPPNQGRIIFAMTG